MSENVIVTENLSKQYDNQRVLSGINMQVPKESVFAFLGPNGAGKTTTIKILTGLVRPTEGTVEVLGEKLGQGTGKYREKIGYIPDNPEIFNYMTVSELVGFCRPLYPKWDDKITDKVLEVMEISKTAKAKSLSRGQKAAVALALALGPRPELVILDEPATQFDPVKKKQFYSLLFKDVVGAGGTIFLATHQLNEVERFADYACFINKGKLVMVKPVDELKKSEKRIRVVFQGAEPAELINWPGVRRIDRQGKSVFVTVAGDFEDVWIKLNKYPHFALELIDMDLEDIFLEYAGEGRRNR